MSEDRPRGFSDETHQTPMVGMQSDAPGPKRPCLVVIAGAHLGEIFSIDNELIIGRDADATLRLADDEGVSRRHASIRAVEDGALLTDLGSQNGTFVDGARVEERLLKEGQKIRVGQTTVLKFTRYDYVEEAAQRQLLESALRDGLTRAFNRRYFLQRLGAEVRFADRHRQPLALLLLDVDHFKQINDQYGHPAGDNVLRRMAEVLSQTLRAEDVLARYGGEEFAVLARGITLQNAAAMGERLRKRVAAMRFENHGQPLELTTSIGVAVFPFEESSTLGADDAATELIARADAALYRAKNGGRNRVEI
jgi:diguanylate cyclase (GGDEF)-like protein